MNNNLDEKIDLIQNLNIDDSRFIVSVYTAYKKHQEVLDNKIKASSIIAKSNFMNPVPNIVDLDLIWCKPYFYTKMRLHLNSIIEKITNTSISKIAENPSLFCRKISISKISRNFKKSDSEIDIVDFIKVLAQKKAENPDYNTDFIFIAEKIDEEAIFKKEHILKAIDIINTSSSKTQFEKIYNDVYSYLKEDFVANNFCDFQNNKCVSQRHFRTFPLNRKNGCCFTRIRTCPHLQNNGSCDVECMACRLFSCPYLSKRGIEYYAGDFVLLKAFLTKKQRKHLVFDFYASKEKVLHKVF